MSSSCYSIIKTNNFRRGIALNLKHICGRNKKILVQLFSVTSSRTTFWQGNTSQRLLGNILIKTENV